MGRDITEHIDEFVENNYGHTNWGYTSTYFKEELDDTKIAEYELGGLVVIWLDDFDEEE